MTRNYVYCIAVAYKTDLFCLYSFGIILHSCFFLKPLPRAEGVLSFPVLELWPFSVQNILWQKTHTKNSSGKLNFSTTTNEWGWSEDFFRFSFWNCNTRNLKNASCMILHPYIRSNPLQVILYKYQLCELKTSMHGYRNRLKHLFSSSFFGEVAGNKKLS